MKYFVAQRQHLEPPVGKDLFHLRFKVGLLPQTPEVVNMKKAAPRKVFAKSSRLLLTQVHASGFNDVYIGEFEQIRIHDLDHVGIRMHAHTRQPVNTAHEFAVSARIIGGPAPPLNRKKAASAEFRTGVGGRLRHRAEKSTKSAPHTILGIHKPGEVELWRIRR